MKSKDTKPEMILRHVLTDLGLRYRIHYKNLPGTPDVVFVSAKIAVFVHGCFWHKHSKCKTRLNLSKLSVEWQEKLNKCVDRDHRVVEELRLMGWQTLVIWECEIKSTPVRCGRKIESKIEQRIIDNN